MFTRRALEGFDFHADGIAERCRALPRLKNKAIDACARRLKAQAFATFSRESQKVAGNIQQPSRADITQHTQLVTIRLPASACRRCATRAQKRGDEPPTRILTLPPRASVFIGGDAARPELSDIMLCCPDLPRKHTSRATALRGAMIEWRTARSVSMV